MRHKLWTLVLVLSYQVAEASDIAKLNSTGVCTNCNLNGLQSSNLKPGLSITNLSGSSLQQANLQELNLGGANLSGVDLTSATLTGVIFDGADLSGGVKFNNAIISGATNGSQPSSFAGANLAGADFTGAKLNYVAFKEAKLTDAIFNSVSIVGGLYAGADFTSAQLQNISIGAGSGASIPAFNNPNFSGVNLTNAVLTSGFSINNLNLEGAVFGPCTVFLVTAMTGGSLNNVAFKGNVVVGSLENVTTNNVTINGAAAITGSYPALVAHDCTNPPSNYCSLVNSLFFALGSVTGCFVDNGDAFVAQLNALNSTGQCPGCQNLANLTMTDLNLAPGIKITDLTGANLNSAQLAGIDLSGATLSDASFVGADLTGANLSKVKATGIDLSTANLGGANLQGANLYESSLYSATLVNANFIGANLQGAGLGGANLENTNFSLANLTGLVDTMTSSTTKGGYTPSYIGINQAVNLNKAQFMMNGGANLAGVDFSSANLDGQNFADVNLAGAIFTNASLKGAIFDQATNLQGITLNKTDLTGATIGCAISASNVEASIFDSVNFDGAFVFFGSLTGSSIQNANFDNSMGLILAQSGNVATGTMINKTTFYPVQYANPAFTPPMVPFLDTFPLSQLLAGAPSRNFLGTVGATEIVWSSSFTSRDSIAFGPYIIAWNTMPQASVAAISGCIRPAGAVAHSGIDPRFAGYGNPIVPCKGSCTGENCAPSPAYPGPMSSNGSLNWQQPPLSGINWTEAACLMAAREAWSTTNYFDTLCNLAPSAGSSVSICQSTLGVITSMGIMLWTALATACSNPN